MAAITNLTVAERALDKASSPAEVKEIYDMAEAYRVYAKSAEDQNMAAAFKLRAAAKGGDMLAAKELPRTAGPGRGKRDKRTDSLSAVFPALSEPAAQALSSRWQRVAALNRLVLLDAHLLLNPAPPATPNPWPATMAEAVAATVFAQLPAPAETGDDTADWCPPRGIRRPLRIVR